MKGDVVGFIVTDYKGCEKYAVKFIQTYCILDDLRIAKNIVKVGPGLPIYTADLNVLSEEFLAQQPFECTPIITEPGTWMIISLVNFIVEIPYNGTTMRLRPCEYRNVYPSDVSQFRFFERQGLIRLIETSLHAPSIQLEQGGYLLLENGGRINISVYEQYRG